MKQKKGLKKLTLNKDAIAKLNNDEMNSLQGGAAAATYIITPTNSCGCGWGTFWSIVQVTIATTVLAAAGDCCTTINK